jgi:hypothetical protein
MDSEKVGKLVCFKTKQVIGVQPNCIVLRKFVGWEGDLQVWNICRLGRRFAGLETLTGWEGDLQVGKGARLCAPPLKIQSPLNL